MLRSRAGQFVAEEDGCALFRLCVAFAALICAPLRACGQAAHERVDDCAASGGMWLTHLPQ